MKAGKTTCPSDSTLDDQRDCWCSSEMFAVFNGHGLLPIGVLGNAGLDYVHYIILECIDRESTNFKYVVHSSFSSTVHVRSAQSVHATSCPRFF